MNPIRQNYANANHAFNIHVIMLNVCRFTEPEDLQNLRGVNNVCNYASLFEMKTSGHFPTVKLPNDTQITSFLDVMASRMVELPTFSSYYLTLDATTLENVVKFASEAPPEILEFEFVDTHTQSTWELDRVEEIPNEVQAQTVLDLEFCKKIVTILKHRGANLHKLTLRCKRQIPIENALWAELPASFPRLQEFNVHFLSDEAEMGNDIASAIIARSPNLKLLEVTNFFGNGLLRYSPALMRTLARVINFRQNPLSLKLQIQVFSDDLPALEYLIQHRFNRLRSFEFMIRFEYENQSDRGATLRRFTNFLEFQSPTLQELSIVAAGDYVTYPLVLPGLENLKTLEIASAVNFHQNAIQPLEAGQFPKLETLEISGHNLYKHLLGETIFPTVKSLILDLEPGPVSITPVEEADTTNTMHVNFPNLTKLELRDKSYLNLKRVDYVLTRLVNLEMLVLTTHLNLSHKRGNAFWNTFAAGDNRVTKAKILSNCPNHEPSMAKNISKGEAYLRDPSLGNMKKLKVFEISLSLVDQLSVLAYMSRPGVMNPLQKLHIAFTNQNRIKEEDKADYLRLLRQFHREVIVEDLGPQLNIQR